MDESYLKLAAPVSLGIGPVSNKRTPSPKWLITYSKNEEEDSYFQEMTRKNYLQKEEKPNEIGDSLVCTCGRRQSHGPEPPKINPKRKFGSYDYSSSFS